MESVPDGTCLQTLHKPQDEAVTVRRARRRSTFLIPRPKTNEEHVLEGLGDASHDSSEDSCQQESTEKQIDTPNCKSDLLVTVRRSSRKSTAISRYQSTNNNSKLKRNFEFCFEPVPQQVRPILHLSAAQRAARRLSIKASTYLSKKRVCINAEPVVIDITPRSGKIPGVIKMPDSPELLDDEPSAETCIATCRRNILPRLEIDQASSDERHSCSPQNSSQFPLSNLESGIRTDSTKENIAKIDDGLNREEETHLRMVISEVKKNQEDDKVHRISERDEPELCRTLPTVCSIDKISAWMNVCKPLRGNLDGDDNTNSKVNSYKDAVTNRTVNSSPKQHASYPILSFCVEPNKNENKKNELIVGVDSSSNELSVSSRKRRKSFVAANERLNTLLLCKKTSKTVNENAETVRDAKGTASSVQIMNTRLAPIFAKVKEKSKPLESAAKAKKKKDNTAKIEKKKKQKVTSKASKELKPINGNSTEGSKKDRRVELITCVTILDDDSDDVVMMKENNLDTSQKKNTNKKDYGSHGKMIPSRSSTLKKVHIERIDYAPFSSFGHIGLVSDAESSDVPRATPYLRLQKRSSAFVHSELRRPLTFGDSRDWFAERVEPSSGLELMHTDDSEISNTVSADAIWESEETNMNDHQKRIESLLDKLDREQWCDAMKPHDSENFVGDKAALVEVQSWISNWKKHLENSLRRSVTSPSQTERMQKRKNCLLYSDDSDEEYTNDNGDVSESVLILSGPCGCGKSTLVHLIAEELQMRLVELSASEKRSANLIRSKISGATQNYQVAVSPLMRSFNATPLCAQPPIVLIDDADVTFGDEENFWSTLTTVCSEARAPVVVTCSDAELVRRELPVAAHHVNMFLPDEHQICKYLNAILVATGRNDVPNGFLHKMVKYLRYDLRACINHLQVYSTSSQLLLNSIPDEDTDAASGKNENYLHRACYLSSICYHTRQPHLKHSAEYRTHYCGPMTAVDHEEWNEPNRLLSEEYPSIVAEAITPIHASISDTRRFLFGCEYRSLDELACDYVPYLALIDKAWRKDNVARRRLHYFDNFKSNIGGRQLINSVRLYSFPNTE